MSRNYIAFLKSNIERLERQRQMHQDFGNHGMVLNINNQIESVNAKLKRSIWIDKCLLINWVIIAIMAIVMLLMTGCTYVHTDFVDEDGTTHKTTLLAAPWSKIDGSIVGMEYVWDGKQAGEIRTGQRTDSIDQTAQAQGIEALGRGLMQGAVRGAIGSAGLPMLPDIPTSTETVTP